MRPVLVLQHLHEDGPAYLAQWLAEQGQAMDLRCTEAGQAFPADLSGHRALAILGGAWSANDERPSLRQVETLVRDGMRRGVPVIGHCLGGQLMARALGAPIGPSPQPEVGWQSVRWHAAARDWVGDTDESLVFQWHFEAFGLPGDARALGGNDACPQQAFAVGPHLAMQFHVELDAAKLAAWSGSTDPCYLEAAHRHPDRVQRAPALLAEAAGRLRAQQRLADRLYRRWLTGV